MSLSGLGVRMLPAAPVANISKFSIFYFVKMGRNLQGWLHFSPVRANDKFHCLVQ